ncbi:MAG: PEP-CTERM sorting domain-containing protein [Chthoniobacterales bacterium]
MKKLPSLLAACLLLFTLAFHASGQGLVLMPDSTNNRLVAFDPMNGAVLTSNMFALAPSSTPVHALQVGAEIWVSEQIGDRVARYDFSGNFLGAITGLDNVRGMALIGNTVYVTNAGTNNGAPGNAVVMYNFGGTLIGSFPTTGFAPSPFSILAHQGGILVGSSSANDDIHRFTLTGTSIGTFHNTVSLNFVEQLAFAGDGSILAAGFSSNNIAFLDPNNGNLLSSFAAGGARGVYQLGNGNILWTSGAGASIYDVTTQTSTLVYAGSGRFLQFATIPEPSTLAILSLGALIVGAATRRFRKS